MNIIIAIVAVIVGIVVGYSIGWHIGFARAANTAHELLKQILTKKQYDKYNKRSEENEVK